MKPDLEVYVQTEMLKREAMKNRFTPAIILNLLAVGLGLAGTKTENDIPILKTANNSAGTNFVLIQPNPSLTGFCNQNWVRVSENSTMANILSALAQGKSPGMLTIENAAPSHTVYTSSGTISTTCRMEWIQFDYP